MKKIIVSARCQYIYSLETNTVSFLCYPTDSSSPPEYLKTQIKHITKDEQGQFKGHSLVGLLVLEKQASDQHKSAADEKGGL
ncbi:MAG: hypothetical protein KAU38_00170 [Desulfobacterales bacterium]|nr:hypothetical protein [Desulfobacterales bacterium]